MSRCALRTFAFANVLRAPRPSAFPHNCVLPCTTRCTRVQGPLLNCGDPTWVHCCRLRPAIRRDCAFRNHRPFPTNVYSFPRSKCGVSPFPVCGDPDIDSKVVLYVSAICASLYRVDQREGQNEPILTEWIVADKPLILVFRSISDKRKTAAVSNTRPPRLVPAGHKEFGNGTVCTIAQPIPRFQPTSWKRCPKSSFLASRYRA